MNPIHGTVYGLFGVLACMIMLRIDDKVEWSPLVYGITFLGGYYTFIVCVSYYFFHKAGFIKRG